MIDYYYVVEYFKQLPLLIQVVWMLSTILFFVALTLGIYLKILRSKYRKNDTIEAELLKKYEGLLIQYLYATEEGSEISIEQQNIINQLLATVKNTFKRKIVVKVLLRLRNEISGEMAEAIQQLYFKTGLINYALKMLNSKNWYVVAKGIRELTQFQVKEAQENVVKHINHFKREVRKEVQLYLVNLFNFKGLDFLNDLDATLSEWDQIQLLEILKRFENQQIPNIIPWLKSENNSVVEFALKLAKKYNQFEVKDTLIELLNHTNETIRVQVIDALNYFQVFEAKPILKDKFSTCTLNEQIAFFNFLETIYEGDDESFLMEHVSHSNFEIKYSTLKILKNLNAETFKKIDLKNNNTEASKIYKFVENN